MARRSAERIKDRRAPLPADASRVEGSRRSPIIAASVERAQVLLGQHVPDAGVRLASTPPGAGGLGRAPGDAALRWMRSATRHPDCPRRVPDLDGGRPAPPRGRAVATNLHIDDAKLRLATVRGRGTLCPRGPGRRRRARGRRRGRGPPRLGVSWVRQRRRKSSNAFGWRRVPPTHPSDSSECRRPAWRSARGASTSTRSNRRLRCGANSRDANWKRAPRRRVATGSKGTQPSSSDPRRQAWKGRGFTFDRGRSSRTRSTHTSRCPPVGTRLPTKPSTRASTIAAMMGPRLGST